jgi:gas vesicle protein GvpL/GvpF
MAVQTPPRSATGLYCYGVVAAGDAKQQRGSGLGGKPVKPVVHDGLAALVSEAPGNVRAKRRDLLAHFDVLGTAFEHGTVLPMRFGVVFDNEDSLVRDFLARRHKELEKLLRALGDQVELRVTAHYREDAILAEIVRQNGRVAKLREATRLGGGHPALVELGELVAAEVQARTVRDARALLERLRPLTVEYQLEEEPIEYQLLRGSFLVERRRVEKFDAALEAFAADNAGRIDFKYVGPLPPHSFVELTHGGGR